jgi:cytochrome o ubiquinol oxidase subunit 3
MNEYHLYSGQKRELEKVTFGFWVYLMSDCVLFAALFAAYAVLHTATFGSPAASDLFSLPFVLTETLILLTSSFTCGLALLAFEKRVKGAVTLALVTTLFLGLAFVAMELYEFHSLLIDGHGPSTNAFLSSFFTLVGTHGLHVTLGSLWLIVLLAHLAYRGLTEGVGRKLACFALFWHFLDIIWIFIFTFIYLFGFI